jgi:hypothetical protein
MLTACPYQLCMHGRHHLAGLGRSRGERHHMHEHSRFVISVCDAADHKSAAMGMVAQLPTDISMFGRCHTRALQRERFE